MMDADDQTFRSVPWHGISWPTLATGLIALGLLQGSTSAQTVAESRMEPATQLARIIPDTAGTPAPQPVPRFLMPSVRTAQSAASSSESLPPLPPAADDVPPDSAESAARLAERVRQLEATVRSLQLQPPAQNVPVPSAAEPAPAPWSPGESVSSLPSVCESCASDARTDFLCTREDDKKYPSVKVGGFFQVDAAWFSQDEVNRRTVGDMENGVGFRRARLHAAGHVAENVSYLVDIDFGLPAHPGFADVIGTLHEVPLLGNVRVGFWRQPFGIDALTSATNLTFVERSLPFIMVPFRQTGIGFYDHAEDESMTWAASVFHTPTDAWGGGIGEAGGYGFAGRVTWLPMDRASGKRLVHLGAAWSYFDPANDTVRYATPPEVFLFADRPGPFPDEDLSRSLPPQVDTGLIATRQVNLASLEAAGVMGAAHWQAEYMLAGVNRAGGDSVTFHGGSVQAGLVLTGETRKYDRQAGVLARVVPENNFKPGHGAGAWELAGRYSFLDLTEGDIQGGRLQDVTVGLNWYLNGFTKVQFNWIRGSLDNPTTGDSNVNVYVARTQVDF
ncbi:MAG: porin [Planctomycetaceae bacterium]|nr:porin [Planctomycetaceae bacterium]